MDATEFAELPVRHNEDNINSELAKQCPLKVNIYTMDSPNTKTSLLLQSHFSRLALPSTNYLMDMKSVLDNAPRVLQAMVEKCDELLESGLNSGNDKLFALTAYQCILTAQVQETRKAELSFSSLIPEAKSDSSSATVQMLQAG